MSFAERRSAPPNAVALRSARFYIERTGSHARNHDTAADAAVALLSYFSFVFLSPEERRKRDKCCFAGRLPDISLYKVCFLFDGELFLLVLDRAGGVSPWTRSKLFCDVLISEFSLLHCDPNHRGCKTLCNYCHQSAVSDLLFYQAG